MATVADAHAIIASLPEVTEGTTYGNRCWFVGADTKTKPRFFAWERPFSKADLKRYGDETPPDGAILALRVADLSEKEAVLAEGTTGIFTIPHFDGYAAVLIQLKAISKANLRVRIVDAWLAAAPAKVADEHAPRLLKTRK
jgi:hypothetical protein